MTTTDELLRNTDTVIADLAAAIRVSRRARRACPECGGDMDQAIQQDCQTCALRDDQAVTT